MSLKLVNIHQIQPEQCADTLSVHKHTKGRRKMQYLERICSLLGEGVEIETWYSIPELSPFNNWFYILCPGKFFAGSRKGGLVSFWVDLGDVKTYHFLADFDPNVRKSGGMKLWILPRSERVPTSLEEYNFSVPRRGDFQTELEDPELLNLLTRIVYYKAMSTHTKDHATNSFSQETHESV